MARIFVLILVLIIWPFSLKAQFGSYGVTDARSLGMGNTYNATTYDLYAVGKNPGLLSKTDGCKVTFIFPNLTAQQYGVQNTINSFDYYAKNKFNKDWIVALNNEKFELALSNDGQLFMDALLGFFSVAYHPGEHIGSFAFSMSDYITGFVNIPDVVLSVRYGEEVPGGDFIIDDFDFKSSWLRTYALSYSRYVYKDKSLYRDNQGFFKYISAGITAKYILSYAYTDIGLDAYLNYNSGTERLTGNFTANALYSFSTDLSTVNGFTQDGSQPRGFLALRPAGRGYAFDLGAGTELKHGWTVGLAVTDIGRISWTESATESYYQGSINLSTDFDNTSIDSIASSISLDSESGENFRTPMPTAIRLGVALEFEKMFPRFPGELMVGIDYNQGLNNQPSNFTAARFSAGLSYRYREKWPILIGGYTYDLLNIGRAAIGFGYEMWVMDIYISTIDLFSLFNGIDRFSASLVARWKIGCGYQKNKGPNCL